MYRLFKQNIGPNVNGLFGYALNPVLSSEDQMIPSTSSAFGDGSRQSHRPAASWPGRGYGDAFSGLRVPWESLLATAPRCASAFFSINS
jgi:hypothetical protein